MPKGLVLVIFACLCLVLQQEAAAQPGRPVDPFAPRPATVVITNGTGAPNPDAVAAIENPQDSSNRPAPSPEEEPLPLIILDPNFGLLPALTSLADNAGFRFTLAPDLITNGLPVQLLQQPVGTVQYENITFKQAFDRLAAQHGLIIGSSPSVSGLVLGTPNSGLTPIESEGGDLASSMGANDPNLPVLGEEVPLLTAIQFLGKLAKLNVIFDPRLKTGFVRQIGTNPPVEIPPVATNTVALANYGGVSARQTLQALLNNYGLVAITDPNTGFTQITYKDPAAKEPVYTYVLPLKFANPTNLVELVTNSFPAAKVRADMRTANLVVLSTQNDYELITNFVAQLDTPTKQVLIEAKFLETFHNPKSQKGVNWTDTLQAQRFTMGNGTLSGGSSTTTTTTSPGTPTTTTLPSGRTVTVTPDSTTTETSSSTKNTAISSTAVSLSSAGGFAPNAAFLNAKGVDAFLSLLNTESDSRVVATPRAVTLDNMETRLEVTRSIPIFDASESLGQSGASIASSKPNYTNVGTILIVRPRISGTNVSLHVRPEISKVEPIPSRKTVAGRINEADIFATSRIEAQVMVPSGHTLVMGGLISDSTQKGFTKVPLLGDIPVLGWAFRHESNERSKANLIIFITPTIIEDEDFQPTRTDFLNTPIPRTDDTPISVWDRGRPWNWKGKKNDKFDPTKQ